MQIRARMWAPLIANWQRRCQNWERQQTQITYIAGPLHSLQERYLENCCFIGPLSLAHSHIQSDKCYIGVRACKQSDRIQNGLAQTATVLWSLRGQASAAGRQAPSSYRSRLQSRPCSFDTWHATHAVIVCATLCGACATRPHWNFHPDLFSAQGGYREPFKFSFYGNDAPFSPAMQRVNGRERSPETAVAERNSSGREKAAGVWY